MKQEKLKKILSDHNKWLKNSATGKKANFNNLDLQDAKITRINLRHVDFRNANLHCSNFICVDLCYTDFRNANLSSINFHNSDFSHANLSRVNLNYARFYKVKLISINLFEANLSDADLSYADLQDANLIKTNLKRTNLSNTNLKNVNFKSADFYDAKLRNNNFENTNIQFAKYSISILLHSINWGLLSNRLTLELMRHDAEYIGISEMKKWAKGGPCPYKNVNRDFLFKEQKMLWKQGKPKLRGIKLFKTLCKEKKIKI